MLSIRNVAANWMRSQAKERKKEMELKKASQNVLWNCISCSWAQSNFRATYRASLSSSNSRTSPAYGCQIGTIDYNCRCRGHINQSCNAESAHNKLQITWNNCNQHTHTHRDLHWQAEGGRRVLSKQTGTQNNHSNGAHCAYAPWTQAKGGIKLSPLLSRCHVLCCQKLLCICAKSMPRGRVTARGCTYTHTHTDTGLW